MENPCKLNCCIHCLHAKTAALDVERPGLQTLTRRPIQHYFSLSMIGAHIVWHRCCCLQTRKWALLRGKFFGESSNTRYRYAALTEDVPVNSRLQNRDSVATVEPMIIGSHTRQRIAVLGNYVGNISRYAIQRHPEVDNVTYRGRGYNLPCGLK